jgi:hypothetical protein
MGIVNNPRNVQFFTSILFKDNECIDRVERDICNEIGNILERTPSLSFKYTRYYEKEMGSNLSRIFLLFEPLFQREQLPEIKIKTNIIETSLSWEGKRVVNIDPGYISLENVVLATTKGYAHRVYLNSGIYAELTLIYHNNTYRPVEWTYPDYGSEEIIAIFNGWRSILKEKTRTRENG